jgi:hypothetical protein
MLSTKSLNLLADKIAPQVADFIQNDDRFFDLMCDVITDGVADVLEETDEVIISEIAILVSERLSLIAV